MLLAARRAGQPKAGEEAPSDSSIVGWANRDETSAGAVTPILPEMSWESGELFQRRFASLAQTLSELDWPAGICGKNQLQ